MVKFQIASDLHIETYSNVPCSSTFITPSAKILILAGDIGRIHKFQELKMFLTDICSKFEFVLYVIGNHEYYREYGIKDKSMSVLLEDIVLLEKELTNLYILNRGSVIIDDVCVIGCTLWSQALVNIPSYIVRISGMNTERYNNIFINDVKYIEKMIKYCETKRLKLLVVTHHCPTYKLITDKKINDKFKSLYYSNLDYLLDSKRVHTWICGHIHSNFDYYTINGTRLVGNQKGKPKEKIQGYSLSKVIHV
jgi:predicted phosphodiesterase